MILYTTIFTIILESPTKSVYHTYEKRPHVFDKLYRMKILLKYIIILLVWAIGTTAQAELTNKMFNIRHIGHVEGLSSQRVFSIVEDNHHAMWIATKAGIDRYNGQMVKNYTLEGNFYYGDMAGRRIRLLYHEKYGLWAYDHTGRIYRYRPDTDSFEQELYLGESIKGEIILNKLCMDPNGTLWLGLSKGLYKKAPDEAVSQIIPNKYINDIICVGDSLFTGTSNGVLYISCSNPQHTKVLTENKNVQTLFYDSAHKQLWIGTFNNGLWTLDPTTGIVEHIEKQNSCFSSPIRAITAYDDHTLLIGIDGGGVHTVNLETKRSNLFINTEDNSDIYLQGNGVYAVTRDHQGNIWIGSYTGGVSVAIYLKYPITILNHERGNPQSLANDNVNDIEENTNGDIWFATDDGISILTPSGIWKHILKSTVTVTLCKGKDSNIWAGTYGDGVYQLDKSGKTTTHLTEGKGELTTNYIFSVTEDYDGDLWIGGLDGGLVKWDKSRQRKQVFDVNWIHSIMAINHHQIAVATVNGFCIIDKQSGTVKPYATTQDLNEQNASAYIISMLFNDDGTVWLGTEGGGLSLYNMNTHELKTFTTHEGMLSDDVYSLQRDSQGGIWASTGKGLAIVKDFQVSNLNYIYDIDKVYNKSSYTQLSDGRFAYGSTNGAVFISPDAVMMVDYQAPLRFTDLRVEYLNPHEARQLHPCIYQMLVDKDVHLGYSHNSFVVTFESINYRFQHDIAYQYILDGYEKSWSNLSSNGSVRYTNVSPGTYTLKVRSLRKSNGEIISEQTLPIQIAQPWWNSWYAWIVYICLVGGIFYFILRFKSNQLQKQYDEDKIKFFIDTAHDIRTPVTLIMAPLEDLGKQQELSVDAHQLLDMARNNTRKLHTLITQLLEFEKVDTHKKSITLEPVNLSELLVEECASFQALCDKKQLHLHISLPDQDVYAMADRHLMEMLLDNLLSNACKYTPSHGNIEISLRYNKQKVIIEVKDNGIGIPSKARKHLFNSVYRAENARESHESGTGFGLLQVQRIVKMLHGKVSYESEVNKGTTFSVTLQKAHNTAAVSQTLQATSHLSSPSQQNENTTYSSPEKKEVEEKLEGKDTLLIVEDHEELRYYLRKTFEHYYRVIDVANGKEALDYLSNEYPDLILSDVMMPGIQGDELCQMVKENPDTAGIPFILLTAKTNYDAVVEGLKKGADDYIPKPFSTEILKLKVRGFIENRNRQRDFFMRQALKEVENGRNNTTSTPDQPAQQSDDTIDNQPALSESDHAFVIRATQLVIENISNAEFNINSLCQEMAMSRTLFYSRLKSLTGKAPQEFIRIIRLQQAAELLKQGKNVTEVATDTGFINVKYFSMLFKKQFGIQPSKYEQDSSASSSDKQ